MIVHRHEPVRLGRRYDRRLTADLLEEVANRPEAYENRVAKRLIHAVAHMHKTSVIRDAETGEPRPIWPDERARMNRAFTTIKRNQAEGLYR